jgi:hypothetical protein
MFHCQARGLRPLGGAVALLVTFLAPSAYAADPAAPATSAAVPQAAWSGKDSRGAEIKVPGEQATLVLFLMADQPQSREALSQTVALLADGKGVRPIAVVSGEKVAEFAQKLAQDGKWPGAVVLDADYTISGKAGVHVWPTADVVLPSGERLGHVPGLPGSFAHEVAAYVDCAVGKTSRADLAKRLSDNGVVDDSPQQIAHRHLHVAEQLLEQGRAEQARVELTTGLKVQPGDTALLLALAGVDITLHEPDKALAVLDGLTAGSVPQWQMSLLRGRALIAKGQWDAAAAVLPESIKLNPQPGEAYYLLGLVQEHKGQWEQAAGSYRQAFEATHEARVLSPAPEKR